MTTQETTARRIALYTRVSRRNGRDLTELEKHTRAEQRRYALAIAPGVLELVEGYDDVNVSGKTRGEDRPAFARLMDDIEAGRVHAVVIGYLSRLGRTVAESLETLKWLHERGVTVYIGREQLIAAPGDTATSRLILLVLLAMAEIELERLTEGLKSATAAAIASGVSVAVPYGYRRSNGPGSPLEPDDDVEHHELSPAAVVELVFERRVDGVGATEIARELNRLRVPTPSMLAQLRGTSDEQGAVGWVHNTVRALVAVKTYTGVIPRAIDWRMTKGKRPRRVPCAWEYLPAQHDAIIDDDTWTLAQFKSEPAVRNGSTSGALLEGLVRCESCSRTMRPCRSTKGTLTYKCRGGAACSAPTSITRTHADEHVISTLELKDRRVRKTSETREMRKQLNALEGRVSVLEERLREYLGYRDEMRREHWLDGYRQQSQTIERLHVERDRLRDQVKASESSSFANFRELELDAQRAGLRRALDAVVIRRAPRRGLVGDVAHRVVLVDKGTAPFELSATGRVVEPRPWLFDADGDALAA